MTVTVASFRQKYPEFSDPGAERDLDIQNLITLAVGDPANNLSGMLNAQRWGSQLDYGVGLFVAHYMALSVRDRLTALAGGIPGEVKGPTTSKAVDKVSVSYDTQAVSLTDMGFWGLTTYGLRFIQFARMVGAGGLQL